MPLNLFGERMQTRAPTLASPKKQKTRTQYRRKEWEDHRVPQFYADNLLPATSSEIRDATDGLPEVVLPAAKDRVIHFREPISVSVGLPATVRIVADDEPREVMVTTLIKRAVYTVRHGRRMPLHVPGDAVERMPDYVESLYSLGRYARQLKLTDEGFRDAAHCIHRVRPDDPTSPFRIQPWVYDRGPFIDPKRPQLGRTGGHTHVGYEPTEEAAWARLEKWYLEQRGRRLPAIEMTGTPLSELTVEMIRSAACMQAKMFAELIGDDEDD